MTRGGAFDAIGEHQPPSLVQPQVLLILQRRHRGDRLETVMKCGWAHVHRLSECLDAQRRRVILLEPLDGANDAMIAALALRQIDQSRPEFPAQHAIMISRCTTGASTS